jgi:hypothetical protein
MSRRGLLALLGVAAVCISWASRAPAAQPGFAGTYAMRICAQGCAGRAQAHGYLVLEDAPYSIAGMPAALRSYIEETSEYLLFGPQGRTKPNACFILQKDSAAPTWAGNTPVGFTRWRPQSRGALWLSLYQSPDAAYLVTLRRVGRDLQGRGRSHEYSGVPVEGPAETIHARRIGAPDRGRCLRAVQVEAEAREAAE